MSSYHFSATDQSQLQTLVDFLVKKVASGQFLQLRDFSKFTKKYPREDGSLFSKSEVGSYFRSQLSQLNSVNEENEDSDLKKAAPKLRRFLRKKPIRTSSGVTPVTVLTKPFPCPGKCIFCPSDVRMPKSYLADEPGAQRAERNYFDPYLQTYNRLQALAEIGHNVDKVELIILGGTWSYYPEAYQIWFIKECFRAMNEFGQKDDRDQILQYYEKMNQELKIMQAHQLSNDPKKNQAALAQHEIKGEDLVKTYNQTVSEVYTAPERIGGFDKYQTATWAELEKLQKINETALQRCVGLVVETRPDNISEAEVKRIRRLGATKTQIGFQSLQDSVLEKNKRGHKVEASARAVSLLRQAGFKIHAHWMANLYGSSVEADKKDYEKLFADPHFRPDELKIYPCSLLESAELISYYQKGLWKPYSHDQLLEVLAHALTHTPEYCRLTRVIRDIPSPDIVDGNKKTNFRQIAQQHLEKLGQKMFDIRAREIRGEKFDPKEVVLKEIPYQTAVSREIFLQFVVPQSDQPDKIVAFLRLSLPKKKAFISELEESAIIREIHVYGRAVQIGRKGKARPQHLGFGTRLIERAKEIALQASFKKLAVISGIGTREYYRKKGFTDGELYQFMKLG